MEPGELTWPKPRLRPGDIAALSCDLVLHAEPFAWSPGPKLSYEEVLVIVVAGPFSEPFPDDDRIVWLVMTSWPPRIGYVRSDCLRRIND